MLTSEGEGGFTVQAFSKAFWFQAKGSKGREKHMCGSQNSF